MRFSIRDLLLVTVIVALAVGWWVDRHAREARVEQLEKALSEVCGAPFVSNVMPPELPPFVTFLFFPGLALGQDRPYCLADMKRGQGVAPERGGILGQGLFSMAECGVSASRRPKV